MLLAGSLPADALRLAKVEAEQATVGTVNFAISEPADPSLGALCVGCCHVVVEQADRATRYAHLRSSAKDYGRVAH